MFLFTCSEFVKCAVIISAVGIGIWDTKFGIYHSWIPLSDGKQLHGQVRYTIFCSNNSNNNTRVI